MSNPKLSILILPLFLPYPPDNGGRICTFGFIDYLRKYHRFTLLIPLFRPEQILPAEQLVKEWPDVKIQFVQLYESPPKTNHVPVVEQQEAGFLEKLVTRILHRLTAKKKYQNKETLPEELLIEEDIDLLGESNFTFPFHPHNKKYIGELEKIVKSETFDIIQVSLTRNLNLIHVLPDEPVKIFEEIESRFEVIKDYAKTKNGPSFYSDYIIKNCEEAGNVLMSKYDAVFTLNKKDKEYITSRNPSLSVYESPFGVLDRDLGQSSDPFIPGKIVFSGHEGHYPNVDALNWYIENVHEKVYQSSKLKLHISGNWSVETVNKLTTESIVFEGLVEDFSAFLQNSIMVVPVRIGGGGIRTKILYAMGNSIPVVSTSIGVEGIEYTNESILISDDSEGFSSAILRLIANTELRNKISSNAFALVNEKYNQTVTAELRNQFYHHILLKKTKTN